jgi:hypothetical protein
VLEKLASLRPPRLDLTHVRDIERSGVAADGQVLTADPLILHGHLPPRERDELGARGDMTAMERAAAEGALDGWSAQIIEAITRGG